MKNGILTLAAASAVVASMSAASAAVIYDEGTDGDLDAVGTTIVDLALGSNEIRGSINQTPPAETDRIRFTQIPGLIVESIVLSFAAPFDDANAGQNLSSALFNNVANLFDDNFGAITDGADVVASFMDTFGPETGPLSQDTDGAIWDFQLSAGLVFPAQPWTLTIVTSQKALPPIDPVPLPASAPLILAGLGLLGLMRRKA